MGTVRTQRGDSGVTSGGLGTVRTRLGDTAVPQEGPAGAAEGPGPGNVPKGHSAVAVIGAILGQEGQGPAVPPRLWGQRWWHPPGHSPGLSPTRRGHLGDLTPCAAPASLQRQRLLRRGDSAVTSARATTGGTATPTAVPDPTSECRCPQSCPHSRFSDCRCPRSPVLAVSRVLSLSPPSLLALSLSPTLRVSPELSLSPLTCARSRSPRQR